MLLTKGLKKGEKFEEAGRFFIIEDVLADGNYISREITEAEYNEKPRKEKKAEKIDASEEKKDEKADTSEEKKSEKAESEK